MTNGSMKKEEILAAIRQAAAELGRAPSRGELRRITGVSHYRVLADFRTLREAVRAAGLEPSRKGEKISTGELLKDWKRVGRKLGKRPSRSEYVREGKYSAGALVGRFGTWSEIGNKTYHRGTEARRTAKEGGRELTRKTRIETQLPELAKVPKNPKLKRRTAESAEAAEKNGARGSETIHGTGASDKAIAFEWVGNGDLGPSLAVKAPLVQDDSLRRGEFTPRGSALLAAIPGPLEGKRRVTEGIAAMIVNTLLPGSTQQSALSIQPWNTYHGDTETRREAGAARGIRKDRPVMGAPFSRLPMTNAPVNEMGVVLLFGMMAERLGFQVEWVQGRFYPDCQAKREVLPGKWQHVRIEFEYESKNFLLHGHDPKRCDVIVCWRHNWKACPEQIEVIELSRIFGMR
jgi:hypothetical protein